jgi:hypothetical protein
MSQIPVAGNHVRLTELHPKMKLRLKKFLADPKIKGKVVVSSGVRTYAQQKELYRRYKAGTFPNLVANPDRVFGGGFQGSWHMQQPNHPEGSYGFAVDFRIIGNVSTATVNQVAKEYGLVRTVPSEWWHHQAYGYRYDTKKYDWYPAPAINKEDEVATNTIVKAEKQAIIPNFELAMKTTLRKGKRGKAVELLQALLARKGYRLSSNSSKKTGIDGHFGGYTLRAVKQFQKKTGLVVDGIVGPNTWKALVK